MRQGEVVPTIPGIDQAHNGRQEAIRALQLGCGEILVPRRLDRIPQLDERFGPAAMHGSLEHTPDIEIKHIEVWGACGLIPTLDAPLGSHLAQLQTLRLSRPRVVVRGCVVVLVRQPELSHALRRPWRRLWCHPREETPPLRWGSAPDASASSPAQHEFIHRVCSQCFMWRPDSTVLISLYLKDMELGQNA